MRIHRPGSLVRRLSNGPMDFFNSLKVTIHFVTPSSGSTSDSDGEIEYSRCSARMASTSLNQLSKDERDALLARCPIGRLTLSSTSSRLPVITDHPRTATTGQALVLKPLAQSWRLRPQAL